MPNYRTDPKAPSHLAWEDARDQARAEIRRITRRVTDLVYVEIDKVFERAELDNQEVLRIQDTGTDIARILETVLRASLVKGPDESGD